MTETGKPSVALFVTCLVELYRPSVALAARSLLEAAGARVVLPKKQTCCGQPTYNAGDRVGAKRVARHTISMLDRFTTVVVPSGSCTAMIARHYPDLLADEPDWSERAQALADKSFELTAYLDEHGEAVSSARAAPGRVSYHDGCSGLRELGVKRQPRALLDRAGIRVSEMAEAERCCGFGGLFCVKYDAISETMGGRKLDSAMAARADTLAAGELGCLLHLAGLARRRDVRLQCRHVAEILAGMDDGPAIGEAE